MKNNDPFRKIVDHFVAISKDGIGVKHPLVEIQTKFLKGVGFGQPRFRNRRRAAHPAPR